MDWLSNRIVQVGTTAMFLLAGCASSADFELDSESPSLDQIGSSSSAQKEKAERLADKVSLAVVAARGNGCASVIPLLEEGGGDINLNGFLLENNPGQLECIVELRVKSAPGTAWGITSLVVNGHTQLVKGTNSEIQADYAFGIGGSQPAFKPFAAGTVGRKDTGKISATNSLTTFKPEMGASFSIAYDLNPSKEATSASSCANPSSLFVRLRGALRGAVGPNSIAVDSISVMTKKLSAAKTCG